MSEDMEKELRQKRVEAKPQVHEAVNKLVNSVNELSRDLNDLFSLDEYPEFLDDLGDFEINAAKFLKDYGKSLN